MKKLIFITLIVTLISCGSEETTGVYKPTSIGTQGRVDIIMPDLLWEGKLGEVVKSRVSPLIKYYPNDEFLFDIAHSNKSQFMRGSKKQKNLLMFEISTHNKVKAGINYSFDVWATDQAVAKITGKNQQDLYDIFIENSQEIQDYFSELDIKRLKVQLLRNKNFLAETELLNKHQLSLTVPNDMTISINNESFAALQKKSLASEKNKSPGDLQQFVILYHYPYTDKKQLTKEYLLAKRDSIVKKYFKGTKEGSYMTTASEDFVPNFPSERLFKGNYAFEIRGMYSMVNDFRGGPFINISLIDEKRGRVVTIEGHLFAPKFAKRPYMMELETILNTLYIQ